jgi:hypothetical protein
MSYFIGIDSTNTAGSVQDGTRDFLIEILTTPKLAARLGDARGVVLKTLDIMTSGSDEYQVSGLSLNDIGGHYSFNIYAEAIRKLEIRTTMTVPSCTNYYAATYSDPWELWTTLPSEFNYYEPYCYYTQQEKVSTVYEDLGRSPAGGWAPVSIPAELRVGISGPLTLDNETEQPTNGTVTVMVPLGNHEIRAQTIVSVDDSRRLKFDHWVNGPQDISWIISISSDATLQTTYTYQYQLRIETPIPVDGAGWYNDAESATFSIRSSESPIDGLLGVLGGKLRFQGWYENGNLLASSTSGIISMKAPHNLEAHWEPVYSVPMTILATIIVVIAFVVYHAVRRKRSPKRANHIRRTTSQPRRSSFD